MSKIQTKLVRDVRRLYKLWYQKPGVCSEKGWEKMRADVQELINGSVATLPVPVMDLSYVTTDVDPPEGNPLVMKPAYHPKKISGERTAHYAGRVAQILVEAGHLVFFVTRSTATNALFNKETNQLLMDIIAFAPIVVFYDNTGDNRANGSLSDILMTRQCGLLIKISKKKGRREFSD